jgi:hypothetical protein
LSARRKMPLRLRLRDLAARRGAREFAKNKEVPRPYVFEPPEGTKMEYAAGEKMRFGFTVVGRAAEYMPYFIYAFSKMGDEGIGRLTAVCLSSEPT